MSTKAALAWDNAQPWLPSTRAGLAVAVDKLKSADRDGLFVLLVKAAASGDWVLFSHAMEQASQVKGISRLLRTNFHLGMATAYELAGLPPKWQPLFARIVSTSLAACQQIGSIQPSRRLRTIVLDKAFGRREMQSLNIPAQIVSALYA